MGQPFRQNAAKFSSFLGITARELIPVTLDKWSDLTDEFIKQIWEHIMQKFSFAECYKKYTFGKLRRHWRDYRNLMVKKVMDQAKLVGLKRAATLLKPDSVESMEVCQDFIKKRTNPQQLVWFSGQFFPPDMLYLLQGLHEAINKKYKEMRAKQTLPHRTSRKGFARLEDEMRQKSETPDSISRSDVWIRGYEARKKKNNEDEEVEDHEIVLIRDEMRSGKSDKEIFKKLEADFGETVLYVPHFDMQTVFCGYCFCSEESDFYFCSEKVTFALSCTEKMTFVLGNIV